MSLKYDKNDEDYTSQLLYYTIDNQLKKYPFPKKELLDYSAEDIIFTSNKLEDCIDKIELEINLKNYNL